ncbi:MAG: glycosyltransferase, partial [Candidatus Micrarchaeota archaeon]
MLLEYVIYFLTIYASVFYLVTYIQKQEELADPKPTREPSISILIPAYNEEKTIAKTIESVLRLKYPKKKLEIIVIND